jgi:protein-S-isoprenylcysteine O-methyltransferase Ste14
LEWLLIAIGMAIYFVFPFVSFYFNDFSHFGFADNTEDRFFYLSLFAGSYALLVPLLFYFKTKKDGHSKTSQFLSVLRSGKIDKQIALSYILKLLFIPMMYFGVIEYTLLFWETMSYLIKEGIPSGYSSAKIFNQLVFPMFINATLAIAVGVYLFGYCVENEKLGSKIKSIDSTRFGWIVTVICYAPLYAVVFYIIPKGDQDLAFFKNETITVIVRVFIMLVILFKTWTIFTLGSKSSNLTNRGIVTKGPYKWIRHPHYLAKMIVWWICLVPSALQHPWLTGGMVFWTTIYVLRALTEELHLKKDADYKEYMKEVKWRFIPRIY